jgi:ATP-dependent Zn protease
MRSPPRRKKRAPSPMLRERDNGDRQVIAHHEAGHAAVARALGRPVAVVSIIPRQRIG